MVAAIRSRSDHNVVRHAVCLSVSFLALFSVYFSVFFSCSPRSARVINLMENSRLLSRHMSVKYKSTRNTRRWWTNRNNGALKPPARANENRSKCRKRKECERRSHLALSLGDFRATLFSFTSFIIRPDSGQQTTHSKYVNKSPFIFMSAVVSGHFINVSFI